MAILRRKWLAQPGPHGWQLDQMEEEPSSAGHTSTVD
jgi:hypothetical protein